MKGFTRNIKPLEILTDEQISSIHRGTLKVLERTGLRFEHEKALEVFENAGCQVDHDSKRVRFPIHLVEESLRKCPNSFHVTAREPKNDVMIGGNTTYFCTFPGMETVDLNTWEPRLPTKSEYDEGVRVLDALDNLHIFSCYAPYFGFKGVPEVMRIPEGLARRVRYSSKTGHTSYANDADIFNIKIAKAVRMETMGIVNPSPPLTYYKDAIESAFRYSEAGFPVIVGSAPAYGATGPATIAGSTITDNAELIAGIVLIQLVSPGTRVVASDYAFPLDMRSGSPAFGAIGISLHTVIFNQIWRNYKVPVLNTISVSSSKEIDFQCGYERAMYALLGALSGGHMITLHGGIYGEITYHPVLSILDDDIAGMIGRFLEGVEVNDETLALDLIDEVGPIPGHYLNKEHTRKWWKKEQFIPKVADRLTYPEWMRRGKKIALDYAKERMDDILATHKPTPLPQDQSEELEKILEEAREYYKGRGMI